MRVRTWIGEMRLMSTPGVLFVCLALTACMSVPTTVTPNTSNPIRHVAILPLLNNTNDVEGASYVRTRLAEEVGRLAYDVKPIPDTDELLRDQMGITIGTQLDMPTAQQLGEVLGVDGVMYSSLEDFSHDVYGVTNIKTVRVRAKLVNCKNGEVVWSDGFGVKSSSGAVGGSASALGGEEDDLPPLFGTAVRTKWERQDGFSTGLSEGGIIAGAVMGLTEKVVTKAAKAPLSRETTVAVRGVLRDIPVGPGSGGSFN
ncbi:MAG: DUF799 family lipoprotein [Nitrospira sp.]|nr:DUF799 family lipoprotein [Nitrospira sp.]